MILLKSQIIKAMAVEQIRIIPFDSLKLQENSYDVDLGNWFYRVAAIGGKRCYFGPKWFDDGEQVPLEFGIGLLGMTKEHITTAYPYVGMMKAKSTTGRQFWKAVGDSGVGDVAYSNHWTVEISSYLLGETYVTVGKPFAQMLFLEGTGDHRGEYDGQYTIQDWPICMVPKADRDNILPWEALGERSRQYHFLSEDWIATNGAGVDVGQPIP